MKVGSYFKNLPNMWSANFLAMLGFVSFIFSIIGIASLIFYSHINIDMPYKIGASIKDIGWYFILIQGSLLPVICLLGILPIITQYGILMRPSKNTHLQILLLAVAITLCTLPSYIFYAENGSGFFFAFIPFFCYPVLIAVFFIFITLLFIDLILKKQIPNKNLVKNKYYKFIVNIFFWYSIVIFILAFITIYKIHQI